MVILDSKNRGQDWKRVAFLLGVPERTARHRMSTQNREPLPRRGKHPPVPDAVRSGVLKVQRLNNELTLDQIREMISAELNRSISLSTIHRILKKGNFTTKKLHSVVDRMNCDENLQLRKVYSQKLQGYLQQSKDVFYLDESNYNLYYARSRGRSEIGVKALMKVPASKGKNIHMIGCISASRLEYFETRRGSLNHKAFQEVLRNILRQLRSRYSLSNMSWSWTTPRHTAEQKKYFKKRNSRARSFFD